MQHSNVVAVQGAVGNAGNTARDHMEAAYEKVKYLANTNAVVVFSMSSCCMSHVVKSLLFGLGVGPTIIELDQYESGYEILSVLRGLAGRQVQGAVVPIVFVGGKLLGGIESVIAYHINGNLVPLLKEAGALWL